MYSSQRQQCGGANLPYRWTHPDATPFRPCDPVEKQKGGGDVSMPYRYFNPDATPFMPCEPVTVPKKQRGSGDFRDLNACDNCAMYDTCLKPTNTVQPNGSQTGGALSAHANPVTEGPGFRRVELNRYWVDGKLSK